MRFMKIHTIAAPTAIPAKPIYKIKQKHVKTIKIVTVHPLSVSFLMAGSPQIWGCLWSSYLHISSTGHGWPKSKQWPHYFMSCTWEAIITSVLFSFHVSWLPCKPRHTGQLLPPAEKPSHLFPAPHPYLDWWHHELSSVTGMGRVDKLQDFAGSYWGPPPSQHLGCPVCNTLLFLEQASL